MSERLPPKLHEIDDAFRQTRVMDLSPEQRDLFIAAFCNEDIRSGEAQMRSLIRTLAISHVQMSEIVRTFEGTIKKLDADNGVVAGRVHQLTMWAAWLGGAQVVAAWIGVSFLVHGCLVAPKDPKAPPRNPSDEQTHKAKPDGHQAAQPIEPAVPQPVPTPPK